MEKINYSEREIADLFQIPLRALKRCRGEKVFGVDICFTAPYSHKILYDISKFTEWFDKNKLSGLYTENQYIRSQLKHLNIECKQIIKRGKQIDRTFNKDGKKHYE
tara:strand:+ start:255 stop:572 length:318 start_codon:yes stop_codon:yes gene_type:complete